MAPTQKTKMIILYAMLQQVESKLEQLQKLILGFKFFEFILISYLIIRNGIIDTKSNATDLFNPQFTQADKFINYKEVSQDQFLIMGVIILFFFLFMFISQIKTRSFEKDVIVVICTAIVLISQLLYLYIINQTINVFTYTAQDYPLLRNSRYFIAVFVLLFILYCTIVNRQNHIYGPIYPLLIVISNLDKEGYYFFTLIIMSTLYIYLYGDNNVNKTFVSCHLLIILFYALEQVKLDLQYTQFILLFFFIAVCLVHLFWKSIRIKIVSQNKNLSRQTSLLDKKKILRQYYEYIHHKKQTSMKMQHQLLIESIIIDEYQKCSQQNIKKLNPFITGKKPAQWQSQDHIKFLITQAQLYYSQKKSKQAQTILFSYRLQDNRLHYNSLLQISQRFYKQSIFTMQKYDLYKLMIKLENWFKKFKAESSITYDSIKTNHILLKFYKSIDNLFELFLKVWQNMKKQTIDFSIIEPIYIEAIEQYNKLERFLSNIRKRVKSTSEIFKFNQLSNLLQLKILSKQDYKQSFSDENQQQQIPFIRVSNNKIVSSSYKFNNRYHFSNDEIIGMDVDQILPQSFKQNFLSSNQEIQDGVHLKLKQFYSIILNGKGCLQFVLITPYIEIDFLGQITYMIFFYPKNNNSSPYILYSIQTDVIQQLSNGFLQLFGLQGKDVHNTVTGKQAFQQYDFSSLKNRQQLSEQGHSIQTNMSIFQFKSTIVDRFNKVKVTLRLVHLFDSNESIRLLLQVRPVSADYIKNVVPGFQLFFVNGLNMIQSHLPKAQSKNSLSNDEATQDLKFIADIAEKKLVFNRDRLKNNLGSNHWKSILRICLFILSLVILSVLFFYAQRWYNYMKLQIQHLNTKIFHLTNIIEQNFLLSILKTWPSTYLTTDKLQQLILKHYTTLSKQINSLYLSTINSMQYLDLAFLPKFIGGANTGIQIDGTNQNLLNYIYRSYLIFSYDFAYSMIDNYNVIDIMLKNAPNIEDNFYLFRTWMDICLVVCIFTVSSLIILRIYQMYEDKIFEKVLEDIQMLFSFLNNEEIQVCIEAIQHTSQEFEKSEQSKLLKGTKTKIRANMNNKLKSITHLQQQPFIQKKTSKTSGSSIKSYIKTVSYIAVIGIFFIYMIIFVIENKKQFPNVITYQNQINIAVRRAQSNEANTYYYMIQQKLGNKLSHLQHNNLFVTTLIKNDYLIPEEFKNFYGQIWDILNVNMCKFAQDYELQKCSKSILAKGLVNSLDSFTNDVFKLSYRGLDELFSDDLYQNIEFADKFITKQTSLILQIYTRQMTAFIKSRMNVFIIMIVIGFLIIIFSLFLLWIDIKDQLNRNSICKSLFNIFPQSFFLKNEIKQYLKQTNLTERLLGI